MQIGKIVVNEAEVKVRLEKSIAIDSLKEVLPMKFALEYGIDQDGRNLLFYRRELIATIEDGKDFIICEVSSEEEIGSAKRFLVDLSRILEKYTKIKISEKPQLEKCELELTLPFDYSKLLNPKSLLDLKLSKKGELVHLRHLEFNVDQSLSLSIRELNSTDVIPALRQRVFRRALDKYMPRELATRLYDGIFLEMNNEFTNMLKKHRIGQIYKLEVQGDSFEKVHSILSQILETFPKKKRTIMQRRFQFSIHRLTDSLYSTLRRVAEGVGLPKSAIRRLLIEIKREEDRIRETHPRAYDLSDFV